MLDLITNKSPMFYFILSLLPVALVLLIALYKDYQTRPSQFDYQDIADHANDEDPLV